jgi:hypothetical protein
MSNGLEGKLEDIKFLKVEHGIGSKNAFDYLKSVEKYTELRDEVVERLKSEGVNYRPSVREVIYRSSLCKLSYEGRLNIKILESSSERESLPCLIRIPEYFEFGVHSLNNDEVDMGLKLDYPSLLVKIYENYSESGHVGNEFYYAQPFLNFKSRKISANDFVREFEKGLLGITKKSDSSYSKDLTIAGHALSHSLNLMMLENEKGNFARNEKHFLYQSGYERAKEEMTLNRFEVERMIAFNRVVITPNILGDINERINLAIGFAEKGIGRADSQEEAEKHSYFLRSIKKNKKWLEKMLSN